MVRLPHQFCVFSKDEGRKCKTSSNTPNENGGPGSNGLAMALMGTLGLGRAILEHDDGGEGGGPPPTQTTTTTEVVAKVSVRMENEEDQVPETTNKAPNPPPPLYDDCNNNNNNETSGGSPEFREVVIVGNGPSGITLSYLLSGHWPYYNGKGQGVLDDMFHQRLITSSQKKPKPSNGEPMTDAEGEEDEDETRSLVCQDLAFLSQDLEGRSSNPTALLYDSLNHPQADLGLELSSLLDWKYKPEREVSHVVLGKGPPGGAWQSMDGNVLTISGARWMELPGMTLKEWENTRNKDHHRLRVKESRATASSVADYYRHYVRSKGVSKFFREKVTVTEVSPYQPKGRRESAVDCSSYCYNQTEEEAMYNAQDDSNWENEDEDVDSEGGRRRRHTISEIVPSNIAGRRRKKMWKGFVCKRKHCEQVADDSRRLWRVSGYSQNDETARTETFSYITPNVVLATGTFDVPNVLSVEGERRSFVLHSLNELEQWISSRRLTETSDPVMIIGSGLTAADAIISSRFYSIPVVHVFRKTTDDKSLIFQKLSVNMYPEYHKVYQMMKYPSGYENYKVLDQHVVVEILSDNRVKLVGPQTCSVQKVSCVVICIGSHPELGFLGDLEYLIGIHPGAKIGCKNNPVAINYATHECPGHPGLYALGPLVGDNFVRFLQGGALAITNHLFSKQRCREP